MKKEEKIKWNTYHTKNIKSKYLYRYVSIEKLISFLNTGSLYFARMDSFEDNLEGIIPYDIVELFANYDDLPSLEERNPEISKEIWKDIENHRAGKLTKLQESLLNRQKERFVSCWFLSDAESIAMWDLYATDGFLIRFDRQYLQNLVKLRKDLQEKIPQDSNDLLVAGRVRYQNFNEVHLDEEGKLIRYSGFRKHVAFKHEAEYRFILHKKKNDSNGIFYSLGDINELKFDLFANPRMKSFTLSTYNDIIKKYNSKFQLKESELKPWLHFKETTF
ncbi:DUF2971 domain-containing protein [Tenacibaculum amylolyticum]|uniref:DUF2971 domain-containing protein n=1 Tax=Tenacibaculum amylolyticum TaxID=104269 RepID=UPI003895E05F